jgi:WD40 repeat protein
MWLGSKFTLLSDTLFKSLFRFLFRYDIFISYARRDGKEYALKLSDQLKQLDFSCFLDHDEAPPGTSLNNTLKRALKRSATLVVVGTERAAKSHYVELEVSEFARTRRAIIPIDIEGTLVEMPWKVVKERDLIWIDEAQAALAKGVPSPNVADSIDKLFKYTRRNSRVRAQVFATIILFLVGGAVSLFEIRQNVNKAVIAAAEARNQKTAADEATKRAEIAQANAEIAEKAAGDATKVAKWQEAKALANAETAKRQQQIAEERTNYVRAQQMGVKADIDIDKGSDPERSVLLSVESLERALTPDGYKAWARGMELLPHADELKFARQEDNVSAIAYSPDGRFFAQGTKNGAVTFFRTDGTAGPVKKHLQSDNEIKVITFGKDWVAAASEGEFVMWDLKGFNEIRSSKTLNGFHGQSIAFSPDGRYVATGGPVSGRSVLRVFDTTSATMVIQTPIKHVRYVMSIAFSTDGKWLAAGCHYRNNEDPRSAGNVTEIVDSQLSGGRVLFWDVASFEKGVETTRDPVAWVEEKELIYRATFGPKGGHLATEDMKGVVRVWQMFDDDGHIKLKKLPSQEVRGSGLNNFTNFGKATLVFSPDETYIATAPDKNTARIWDVGSGREISRIVHKQAVESIAFSPDGQFATAGGDVKFWKTEFGSEAKRLAPDDKTFEAEVKALAISPGGEWLVTANDDGAHVFRTTDWSLIKTLKEAGSASKMVFSPDGRWFVIAGKDKTTVFETKRWEARNEILPSDQQPSEAQIVGFSPSGRWLTTAFGALVKLFEPGSWREVRTLPQANTVSGVAFSPDGKWLAALVKGAYPSSHQLNPSEIHIWNTSNWTPAACRDDADRGAKSVGDSQAPSHWKDAVCANVKEARHEVPQSEVQRWKESSGLDPTPSASPDGRWVVQAGNGINLFFENSLPFATLMPGASPGSWTFTPDSRWLVVAEGKTVAIWPLERTKMIDAACARLRRRNLTEDEWHFADNKLQPCSLRQP